MNTQEVIERLKQEANSNPAANAIFLLWSIRERARHQVTLNTLILKMKAEGFDYSRDQVAQVLKTLSDLGFGKLVSSHRGKVRALTGVTTTLQSIGQVAIGKEATFEMFHKRRQYGKMHLVSSEKPNATKKMAVEKPEVVKSASTVRELQILAHGVLIKVTIPEDSTPEQISRLISGINISHVS